MSLKLYRPTTPGQRHLVQVEKSQLWKGSPLKCLSKGISQKAGRNNTGRITVRRKGGGHKKKYRLIDFLRMKDNMPAVVQRIEYDPNRTAFVALIQYEDGLHSYILAPHRLKVGDTVISSDETDVKIGNCMKLKSMPIGTVIHNVEMKAGKGGQIARSAGCYAQIVGRDLNYIQVKLNSGELRQFHGSCKATIGSLSNPDKKNEKLGKAGRSRWLGVRPSVRGVAMNPVDHPHGGGEGKTSGGRHPVTPWGVPTKGKKTRKNKVSEKFILARRKKK